MGPEQLSGDGQAQEENAIRRDGKKSPSSFQAIVLDWNSLINQRQRVEDRELSAEQTNHPGELLRGQPHLKSQQT